MPDITISIPDPVDPEQLEALTQYLTHEAVEIVEGRLPLEDDPAWRAEAIAGMRAGMADFEAGRFHDQEEARRRAGAHVRQLFAK